MRRVVKVIAPRGHTIDGALLQNGGDGHCVEYEYPPPGTASVQITYGEDEDGAALTLSVHSRFLRRVLRPHGMISSYEWNLAIQVDESPRGEDDPQQVFIHNDLASLRDGAGVGYGFAYQHDDTQPAYNAEPGKVPHGWYNKTGLRRFIYHITLPGGYSSSWQTRVPGNGTFDPALLNPELVALNVIIQPVRRTVRDAAGQRRSWIFDEARVFAADEIQDLLYPSEDNARHIEWLILWTRVTIAHPLPHPSRPNSQITETALYNENAGLAPRELCDFCENTTRWEHEDTWSVADVDGLAWLGTILPAWYNTHYPDPAAGPSNQVRILRHWTGSPVPVVDYSVQYTYTPHGCRSHRWVNPTGDAVPSAPPTGVDTFTCDRENRLTASHIAAPAPPGVDRTPGAYTFRYDHRTRRLLRISPTAAALITFSGGLSVQEYDATAIHPGGSPDSSAPASSPVVEYIRGSDYGGGIGGILYSIRAGQASCQHYNSRGDVIAKSDATPAATVTWAAAYLAFGTRPEECGTNPDPHRANTKEEDRTGLLNEGHRYRCLETGMFISRDPAGFVDGPNLYAYVRQNPWTSFDAHGLSVTVTDRVEKSPQGKSVRTTNIKIKAVLINSSKTSYTKAQLEGLRQTIQSVVQQDYTKHYERVPEGAPYSERRYQTEVDIRVVDSPKDIAQDDHVYNIVDKLPGTWTRGQTTPMIGGRLIRIGSEVVNDVNTTSSEFVRNMNRNNLAHVISHETGHALGLRHPKNILFSEKEQWIEGTKVPKSVGKGLDGENPIDTLGPDNVMRYNNGRNVERRQLYQILLESQNKRLNQGKLEDLGKPLSNPGNKGSCCPGH